MVSKIKRRSPIKRSPKPCRFPRRIQGSSSPLKSLAAASAAVSNSIRSCRLRLLRIFSHITVRSTPNFLPSKQCRGFHRLKTVPDNVLEPSPPLLLESRLPPLTHSKRRTVYLDLDETLVHSTTDPAIAWHDFTVYPEIEGQVMAFFVCKRPGVDEFLRELSEFFEVIVFTAGLRAYASLILDRLDPDGKMISHRLYRDSCKEVDGKFVKDLSKLGRELSQVVIVDDNPNAYELHPENAVPVAPFTDDPRDQELKRVMEFFRTSCLFDDMREAVTFYLRPPPSIKN